MEHDDLAIFEGIKNALLAEALVVCVILAVMFFVMGHS